MSPVAKKRRTRGCCSASECRHRIRSARAHPLSPMAGHLVHGEQSRNVSIREFADAVMSFRGTSPCFATIVVLEAGSKSSLACQQQQLDASGRCAAMHELECFDAQDFLAAQRVDKSTTALIAGEKVGVAWQ